MLLIRISISFLLLAFIQDVKGFEEGSLKDDNGYGKCNGSSQMIPGSQDGSFANKSSNDNNCGKYQNDFHHKLVNLTK